MSEADLHLIRAAIRDEIEPLQREIATLRARLGESTLTQKEVCTRYNVSPSTVLRAANRGDITRLGTIRRPRYDVTECDRAFTR